LPVASELADRIDVLLERGVITEEVHDNDRKRERLWRRGVAELASTLGVSVKELLARSDYVQCRTRRHTFLDDTWVVDHWVNRLVWVETATCDSCSTNCYRVCDGNLGGRVVGNPWYNYPPDYSFDGRAKGLTPRDWRIANSYLALRSRVAGLEANSRSSSARARLHAVN
jgi:hypothetical protein